MQAPTIIHYMNLGEENFHQVQAFRSNAFGDSNTTFFVDPNAFGIRLLHMLPANVPLWTTFSLQQPINLDTLIHEGKHLLDISYVVTAIEEVVHQDNSVCPTLLIVEEFFLEEEFVSIKDIMAASEDKHLTPTTSTYQIIHMLYCFHFLML